MKQQLLTALAACSLFLLLSACRSASSTTIAYGSYEIECAGAGPQGTQLVKVWVNDRNTSMDTFKRYAVHGVIFKGYAGGKGCTTQKPLATSPVLETQRANFFNPFFNTDKAYNKYASQAGSGIEQVKAGSGTRSGVVIAVAKDMLRADLEAAGVLRRLSDGF